MPESYLVTGADGFLGRHFLASLAQTDLRVRAMIQSSAPETDLPGHPEIVRAELLEPDTLATALEGVTHVIHLAARVHQMNDTAPDPLAAFREVNVKGTENLLDQAAHAGVKRFLFMSTVKAMGEEDTGTFDENSPCNPESPYGISKREAELLLLNKAPLLNIEPIILRLPMVYGPGAKGNVLRLLEAARNGRKLPFGRIHNRRSMVYVGNVADAALLAIQAPQATGEVYLVCDERPYSTCELYGEICKAMGKEPLLRNTPVSLLKLMGLVGSAAEAVIRRNMPVNRETVQRITGDLCFSPEKIQTQLGYEPVYGLQEGIAQTVISFQNQHS